MPIDLARSAVNILSATKFMILLYMHSLQQKN